MLLLSRKIDQRIFIDAPRAGRIELTVCKIENGRAAIGFEAPLDFKIVREEIDARRNTDSAVDHCHAG